MLRARVGRSLAHAWVKPPRPVNNTELLRVHTEQYLRKLCDPNFIAQVLEIPQLRWLPGSICDRLILRPMRWATMGTIVAAREAMDHGLAVNLSGGYHHASPDFGHGFSAYADIGLAIHELRRTGRLGEGDKVVYVDLDAHQGNGVCRTFVNDSRIFIYDQYNALNFPFDQRAQRRIDCDVQLAPGCHEIDYLARLQTKLPPFLDAVTRTGEVKLAIYNAGTDIYSGDRLACLKVSAAGVLKRDRFVLEELTGRKIPTVVLLSGGYSSESYRMVAEMVAFILETWGTARV
jgi:histone deacetylase 11